MNHRWLRLFVGFGLLTFPTVLTGSATVSSFEALPLLGAVAIGTWLRVNATDRDRRLTQGLWTLLIVATFVVTTMTLLPLTRPVMVGFAPHENTLAAHLGCLSLVSFCRLRKRWFRFLILGGAIVTSLELESRSVAFALVAILLAFIVQAVAARTTNAKRSFLPAVVLVFSVVIGLGLAVLAVPNWRAQAVGVAALFAPGSSGTQPSINLVPVSEMIGQWPWSLDGVTVSKSGVDHEGNAVFTVTKTVGSASARPQFRLELASKTSYTLSLGIKAAGDAVAGLTGWAPPTEELGEVVFRAGYRLADEAADEIDGSARELAAVASSDSVRLSVTADATQPMSDGWMTLVVHLSNHSSESRPVWLGPSPDIRPGTIGSVTLFSRFAVQEGVHDAVPYVATELVSPATVTALSRRQTFSLALSGILTAPWLGHGHGSYRQQQLDASADSFAFSHAHNLALHVMFERGLVGLLGLSVLVAGLLRFPLREWPTWNLVVAGVLLMNLTDMTFWSAAVTLPLGLALGSTVSRIEPPARATQASSEPLV